MSEDEDKLPEQVDAEEARVIVAKGRAKVIDVRSAEEFADERITGSTRSDPDDVGNETEGDPRDAILVVCADGERSAEVAERLRGDGVEATSLKGGFEAWRGDHLPTAPTPDEEYEGPAVKLPGAVAPSGDDEDDERDEGSAEAESDEQGERAEPRSSETADEERAERAEET